MKKKRKAPPSPPLFPPISDDQPMDIELTRFPGDTYLRGSYWVECCDCGLTHLLTFQVMGKRGEAVKTGARSGFLVMRAYRCPLKMPRKKRSSR